MCCLSKMIEVDYSSIVLYIYLNYILYSFVTCIGEDSTSTQSPVVAPLQSATSFSGPSSLVFTIDFGQTDDKPQIIDRWTNPTPFRAHISMQRRSALNKPRMERNETFSKPRKVVAFQMRLFNHACTLVQCS